MREKKKGCKGKPASMVKKITVALVAVMMVAVYGFSPVPQIADEAFAEEWYTMDDSGKVTITEGTTNIDTTLNMNEDVTEVIIPASVTDIEDMAFMGCSSLTSVIFEGAQPPSIGYGAFQTDGDEVTVTVPAGAKDAYESVLGEAFVYIDYTVVEAGGGEPNPEPEKPAFTVENGIITDFELPEELTGGTPSNPKEGVIEIPESVDGVAVTGIGSSAFEGKFNKMVSVTVKLPKTITYIDDDAFSGCFGISKVEAAQGSQLKTIGKRAFYNCQSLTTFAFPDSLEKIDYSAFANCFDFKGNDDNKVVIPAGTEIMLEGGGQNEDSAFFMCSSIEKFVIDASNNKYKTDADGVIFSKDGKTLIQYPLGRAEESYKIADGVEKIAANAFKWHQQDKENANNLKSVEFPNSLKTVENNAFMCSGLESVSMPADVNWGTGVFQLNENLKEVTINEGVKEIPDMFFYGLENLEKVNLPDSLKTIGYRAFDGLNLTAIELPDGLETIGEEAFESGNLKSIKIPASVTKIGDRAFYLNRDLEEITFEDGNKALDLGKYTFNSCYSLVDIEIPSRVTKLDDGVLSNCAKLKTVKMDSVKTLGDGVFAYSGLEEMNLPGGIKSMGDATFFGCLDLKSASLPERLEELGACTFEMCELLTEVNIADTVKFDSVPEDTFWGCEKLVTLTLPESVKATKACAFSGCKELKNIEVKNVKDEFKRSEFDCYAIKFDGDYSGYGYWVEGVFYLYDDVNLEDVANSQDPSEDAINNVKDLNDKADEETAKADGAALITAEAAGTEALCGCSIGGGGSYSATANPTFNYKTPSSNTAAGGGHGTAASGNGGSPATGDDAGMMIFLLLAMISGTYVMAGRHRAKQ